ncbi:guanine deaminase [Chromobacterium violaceum]|uniref:guanine deaminase n=1 Tax=Chromobacterium violaceum TaxID=536 RepID=UPI00096C3588|nr:guanine deaminase [Chromobacterium violaceum]OLZ75078.1 guanine deaminase [Chromobacterium violaceum]STB71492.1 Guanine deaminase [Chromobacterium violaceum]
MQTVIRGAMLTFKDDPFLRDLKDSMVYESDALIVMEDGKITAVGNASDLIGTLPAGVAVTEYKNSIIVPGFIDSHVHYPQTQIIGAYGEQLLDWLNNYTFIAEQQFAKKEHATEVAEVFLREQLKNGVTSSTVYCTVYPQSVDAFFEVASRYNMRVQAGKICMDRNAPEPLLDTPQRAYEESSALAKKWHGSGRNEYVITPRFAPTSTPEQLEMVGQLATDFPTALIQSHVSENVNEVAWVKSLYPECGSYTGVYHKYGLMRERAIYGHGIHLTDEELEIFADTKSAVAHCPTSNFFLGSGAFNVKKAKDPSRPIRVGLATDLGAGTSFSMLQTLNEAYKSAQLNGNPLSARHAFYLASRGTAEALGLADKIGTIAPGFEADLAVIDLHSTPIIDYRMKYCKDLDEALFIQMTLGDDRAIAATYVAGNKVYSRD